MTQLTFFTQDVKRMLGKYKIRILHIWLSRVFWGVLMYRIERSFFLIFKKYYGVLRVPFIPIFNIFYAYSNLDINYKADIKGGILVLHPAVGVVISGQSVIGKNITLTGGNIIGAKKTCEPGSFVIGDYCNFGANATLIGPLVLGNNITVGASACVVKSCTEHGSILMGVPAEKTN
ncbi:serine acetyltransferase [Flavobacteriaceae bacterium S356]|uniref:Serine acetyltransferase n=1 Tax=Asprobacillus argus TaxID=3076534 RepID=A0ABU3LIS5_9FLAO|nr:serine acetyltransferase [Flavobacteriaceae bacterium S356]